MTDPKQPTDPDPIWHVMVDVQIARRSRQPTPIDPRPAPTLRSIRELLLDDHYALLMAGDY